MANNKSVAFDSTPAGDYNISTQRKAAVTFGEAQDILVRQSGIFSRYVYLDGSSLQMVETLPHNPGAFALSPEASRSKITATLPFIIAGRTNETPSQNSVQARLRDVLEGAANDLTRASVTDDFRDGQRIVYDYYQWQHTMDKLTALLVDYHGKRIRVSDMMGFAVGIVPNSGSTIPVFGPDIKFSRDMDIQGLMMAPQVERYDTYLRRGSELNYKVRDILSWLTGRTLSLEEGVVYDLMLRLQYQAGGLENLAHRIASNIGDRVRAQDIARIAIFSKVIEGVFTHYVDVLDPLRRTEFLLRAKAAYNPFIFNSDYMNGFWRGDIAVGGQGGVNVGWLPLGSRDLMSSKGISFGLVGVEVTKDKGVQASVEYVTHEKPVLIGGETTSLGNSLILNEETDKDMYPVRGQPIGGLVSRAPKSLFDDIDPHVTALISKTGPFPLQRYDETGLLDAMLMGNVSVLGGSSSFVRGQGWSFDKARGVWIENGGS